MDVFSKKKRSWIMSRVRGRDTKPELKIRSLVHRMGFRFRLGNRELPGNPDLKLPRLKKVIFVHGCFWHGHKNCSRAKLPATNVRFWKEKIAKNALRDSKNIRELRTLGWKSLVIWQCELNNTSKIQTRLGKFLKAAM